MLFCKYALMPAATAAFLGLAPVYAQTDANGPTGAVPQPLRNALEGGRARVVAPVAASTANMVRLDYATFDPIAGEPAVPEQLRATALNELYLVQFVSTPLEDMRREITQMGGRVERFLTDNTHVIRMNAATRAQVTGLPYVRWVGAYHPAYRVPAEVLATLLVGEGPEAVGERYSIECMRMGPLQQQAVADLIVAIGGIVDVTIPDQYRLEATLTPSQLLQIVQRNEVNYVDQSGAPYGQDMDIIRQLGGAVTTLSNKNVLGQGVRGEVFDYSMVLNHEQWAGQAPIIRTSNPAPVDSHGTACYGINFATGTPAAQVQATGLLPQREQGIFSSYNDTNQAGLGSGVISRLSLNTSAVNAAGTVRSCFQSSSVGSPRVLTYTTVSAEVDDYLFRVDYLSFQSQSNAGNRDSRPQAWAKNIVSIGGIDINETVSKTDDIWASGASIGPADDLRVKPDLASSFDQVYTTYSTLANGYGQFNGTSSATPCTSGYGGLLQQMWHEGFWSGFGGGSTVFSDRPKSTTAKALMINTAYRYPINSPIVNNMYRARVGWGTADLTQAVTDRATTFIVNETNLITQGATDTYILNVAPGTPEFRATMIFADPQGNPAAAQDRINDLSLKVTSPSGVIYWGNNGMVATAISGAGALVGANFSVAGGAANTVDTVENVFLANPAAGQWTVQVVATQIVQDGHTETAALDADYALVVAGVGAPVGPFAYSVQSNGNGHLYRIDLGSGAVADLGLCGLTDLEGLSFGPNGDIFGLGGSSPNPLWNVSLPPGSAIGNTNLSGIDAGLDYFNGNLYAMSGTTGSGALYRINPATAASTLIGTSTTYADNIAIDGLGNAYAVNVLASPDDLYSVNLSTGAFTLIGSLGVDIPGQLGTSFDAQNRLWAVSSGGAIYTINTSTGVATDRGSTTLAGIAISGFEGLAIDRYSALSLMALPAQTGTFTGNTRGYYFTAPYNGQISGLRVPDPTNLNSQNVEIVRLAAAPPAFPETTNEFVSLFRATGVTGDGVIPCDIPVAAGDIIGVLGSQGATGVNSYSASAASHPTTMKGLPVSMVRMGMQFNVATTPAQNLWRETPGAISRVEIYYTDGRQNLYLDGDQARSGSNLLVAPLSNVLGATTFAGEFFVQSDPELTAAGSQGQTFDIVGTPPTAQFTFNFDVDSATFIYGGNSGDITVEARNAAGTIVDSFFQADTFGGQPAGPRTLAGTGIRTLRWLDSSGGYAPLDNIRIHATNACYANCDNSTAAPILNVNDFICFGNLFAAGDPRANCDGSTAAPVLNVNDFICFNNKFAAGCN
jgi:hypothetical protein